VNKAFNDEKTKLAEKQKEEELQIIKDFQKSQLSDMDREKLEINENYDSLKEIYKKYGYDTVELEKDRQKQLKNLEIQGYKDSLNRISDYVSDVKTLWDGLIDTWEIGIDVYNRFIKSQGQTPALPNIPTTGTAASAGVGIGTAGGAGLSTLGQISLGVGTLYGLYKGYKSVKANQEAFKATNAQVTELYNQGKISQAEAAKMMLDYFTSSGNELQTKGWQKVYDQMKSRESEVPQITSGKTKASSATATANLAPMQLTLNVVPASQRMYDEIVDTVAQGLKRKGYLTHDKRF
jgi:hypothetical protein